MRKILTMLTFGIFWATTAHTPVYVYVNPINNQLVQAVIHVESRGNPKAINKKGAIGLMQIMPLWVKELKKAGIIKTKQDLFCLEKNVLAGTYILTKYHRVSKGDMRKTLKKYSGNAKGYHNKIMEALWKTEERTE